MKKRPPLWLLGVMAWLGVFGALACLTLVRPGRSGRPDWLGLGVLAGAAAVAVVMFVRHGRGRPSPEQQAALSALFQAGPGTLGAVVVTRNGVPEVLATVRTREEYLELVHEGRLPPDHRLYLPDDA